MPTPEPASDMPSHAADPRPLVLHVVYRFDTGGLENGVVNLINHMPPHAYRHAVLALTEVTDFKRRVQRPDVDFIALAKPPGHGVWLYPRLYRLFRQLKPAVVHSRNLAALEVQMPAWAAGVPLRVHGEHGRDVGDLDGSNVKLQRVRRAYRPFVHHYIALSSDLGDYLEQRVHVPPARISRIYNGVDIQRFVPALPTPATGPDGQSAAPAIPGSPFLDSGLFLVGSVGRMQQVKDPLNLAQAFVLALKSHPALAASLRLVMVGDGPLRAACADLLASAGLAGLAWLPGERHDVADVMRGLSCFALPSLAEGISNTILEAMACGLPVVATRVGGNAELVRDGQTGEIVPAADPQALAAAIVRMASDPARAVAMGRAGRADAMARFSLQAMVSAYQGVYDSQLARRGANASTRQGRV